MKTDFPTIRSREELVEVIAKGYRPKYLFFWGHTPKKKDSVDKSCFSNWFPAPFLIDSISYPTTEHHMMAEKARLFDDGEALEKILEAKSPAEAKNLGRLVKNFDDSTWNKNRFQIVANGNIAKFSQNERLKSFLLNTGNRVLVEASPRDRIWGIGMGGSNEHAEVPTKWRGQNLLGFALMEARASLTTTSR